MRRATSTVFDVTVCLLFVAAGATALLDGATVEQPDPGNPAADRAERLATSTASVEYGVVVPGEPPDSVGNASERHRRIIHGTVAELLGEASMARVALDERRVSTAGREFERRVEPTARSRLAGAGRQTEVNVVWAPYRGAPLRGEFRVGERPPPGVDVRAATLSVPSGVDGASEAARSAARTDGYDGVADIVARAVVDGLFPPARSRLALRGDYPTDRLTADRYRRLARLTGARVDTARQSPTELNRRLSAALADRLRSDMRRRFGSPTAAANAVETATVRVTVRTWST